MICTTERSTKENRQPSQVSRRHSVNSYSRLIIFLKTPSFRQIVHRHRTKSRRRHNERGQWQKTRLNWDTYRIPMISPAFWCFAIIFMDYFFYKTEGNSFNNSYIIKVLFVEFVRTAITRLLICSWWECKTQLNETDVPSIDWMIETTLQKILKRY